LEPIAEEAEARGIQAQFSRDTTEQADVGFYCQHLARPRARLSVVTLHDLAQRHDIWPNFWFHEPWNEFDVGILPGKFWAQLWKRSARFRVAQPRIGVFELGWPKADLMFSSKDAFSMKTEALRKHLNLPYKFTVTYAPSWENDDKQTDFVRSLINLPVNLLLKQAPWSAAYENVLREIRKQNALHKDMAPNVKVIDPEISIMYVLGLTDILVSDESSVLVEAALNHIPTVSVSDWVIPDTVPPRPASVPFNIVKRTNRASLKGTIEHIMENYSKSRELCHSFRNEMFSNIGQSKVKILDLIENLYLRKTLVYSPVRK
jgi:hypothetical protein